MKSRNEIIHSMCMTYRHDFDLIKEDFDYTVENHKRIQNILTSGITKEERRILWDTMAQIFDNCIAPLLEEKNE